MDELMRRVGGEEYDDFLHRILAMADEAERQRYHDFGDRFGLKLYLYRDKPCSLVRDLASVFGVTERAIQKALQDIAKVLPGAAITLRAADFREVANCQFATSAHHATLVFWPGFYALASNGRSRAAAEVRAFVWKAVPERDKAVILAAATAERANAALTEANRQLAERDRALQALRGELAAVRGELGSVRKTVNRLELLLGAALAPGAGIPIEGTDRKLLAPPTQLPERVRAVRISKERSIDRLRQRYGSRPVARPEQLGLGFEEAAATSPGGPPPRKPRRQPARRHHHPCNVSRERVDELGKERRRLGLTLEDVGAVVGVSGSTISSWERGKTRPTRPELARWRFAVSRSEGSRERIGHRRRTR